MEHLSSLAEWRSFCESHRRTGQRIGLVPTMGALHAGHASLFRTAAEQGDVVVATLFVNPRQFNDAGDLARYPRTPAADAALAESHGVHCLVEPAIAEMWPDYPAPTATTVSVHGLGDVLEGAGRPGHFDGVASVVAKLFALTGPCRAYFGEKDFQQLCVIRQMVRDLSFDVEVVGCPIVREPDGLALSSRNQLLDEDERARALGLARALATAAVPASASELRARMRAELERHGLEVAYAEVVDPKTLVPSTDDLSGPRRALVAASVHGVRLIDNGPVTVTAKEA